MCVCVCVCVCVDRVALLEVVLLCFSSISWHGKAVIITRAAESIRRLEAANAAGQWYISPLPDTIGDNLGCLNGCNLKAGWQTPEHVRAHTNCK